MVKGLKVKQKFPLFSLNCAICGNFVTFCELCDVLRYQVDSVKSFHRRISEALTIKFFELFFMPPERSKQQGSTDFVKSWQLLVSKEILYHVATCTNLHVFISWFRVQGFLHSKSLCTVTRYQIKLKVIRRYCTNNLLL